MIEARRTHALKTVQPYYDAVVSGMKSFDIRSVTRPIHVNDLLLLQEYVDGEYTGREEYRVVTYVMNDPEYVKLGTVVLGLRDVQLRDSPVEDVPILPAQADPVTEPGGLLETLTEAVGHFTDSCCRTGGCYCPPVDVYPLIGMPPREPCGGTRCTCGAEHTARKLLPVVEALIEAGVQPLREALLEVQAVQRELNDSGNPILQSAAGRLNGIGAHLWTPEELAALETDR